MLSKRTVLVLAVCAVLASLMALGASDDLLWPAAAADIPSNQAFFRAKTGSPHLDTPLNALLQRRSTPRFGAVAGQGVPEGLKFDGDRVHVTILTHDTSAAEGLIQKFPDLGCDMTAHYEWAIDAWVPVHRLGEVSRLPGVVLVQRPLPPVPRIQSSRPFRASGSFTTQGVAESNAHQWHGEGLVGAGVRVAFIGSFKDWDLAQAAGELPSAELYAYGDPDTSRTGVWTSWRARPGAFPRQR